MAETLATRRVVGGDLFAMPPLFNGAGVARIYLPEQRHSLPCRRDIERHAVEISAYRAYLAIGVAL